MALLATRLALLVAKRRGSTRRRYHLKHNGERKSMRRKDRAIKYSKHTFVTTKNNSGAIFA
jgi:hypothetical protein